MGFLDFFSPKQLEFGCFGLFVFLASIGYWLRSSLFGFDAYAGLNAVKYGFFSPFGSNYPLWSFVLGLLPDSLLLIKFLMFISLFVSLFAVWLMVSKFFDKRLTWLSIFLVVGLSPVVLFSFGEFENEIFSYPLLLLGIYFFVEKKWFKGLFCFGLGSVFWFWFYYLTVVQKGFSVVPEMNMFHGVLSLWFLIPFLFFIPLLKRKSWWFVVFSLFGVVLWLWNAKLWVFMLPGLTLSIANLLEVLENKQKYDYLLKYVYLLAFFCLVGWNIAYLIASPTQNDWKLVETAIQASQDTNYPLYADLGFDYWVVYKTGIEPTKYQQLYSYLKPNPPFILLASQDANSLLLNNPRCKTLIETKDWASQKKVWKCT